MPKTQPTMLATNVTMSDRVTTISALVTSVQPSSVGGAMIFGPAPEFGIITQQIWPPQSATIAVPCLPSDLSGYGWLAHLKRLSTESYLSQKQVDQERENQRCQR